jgi:arylsulfatase
MLGKNSWGGAKEELNAPLLFNLRRDPYERAATESGMYLKWLGENMWAFGPAQAAVGEHLATFKDWPAITPDTPAEKIGGVGN